MKSAEFGEVVPSRTTLRRFGQRDLERYQTNQFAGIEDIFALRDSYTFTILKRHNILTVYGVAHLLGRNWKLPHLGQQRKENLRQAFDEYLEAGHKPTDPPIWKEYCFKDIPALAQLDNTR